MSDQQLNQNNLIETLPTGYARHQVVIDDKNSPIDYIFLTVNAAFEKMTGLKREKILGRKVTEVLPGTEKSEFDWIGIYGKVALGGTSLNFEQYSEPLKRWYDVQAYSDEPGHFTTVINEITARKNELSSMRSLLELSEKLIASDQGAFDYQVAIDSLLRLSGAKFAAINTYEEGRTKTVTRAIAGVSVAIFAASQTLGFEITGRAWDIIPERLRTIEGGKLVRFKNLFETSMGAINETTATMLQELFRIGDIYVLELAYGGRETMGDIIFFMPKKKEIQNREVIELYAGQIGSLLARLKAEEAVSIANKNMTTVLENSLFGVAVIDKKRTIRWVNPVVCKLAGVESPEVLIGSQCGDYLCPAEQHQCPILDNGQKLDNSERILRRSDGQTIPILKSVTEINLEGEDVLLETFIDITERKQAEASLRESEQRYREILETMEEGFYDVDLKGKIIACNRAATKMLGYEEMEIVGKSYKLLVKDAEAVFREFNQAFKSANSQFSVVMEMICKNGSLITADLSITLTRDQHGNITGFRGLGRDITDRIKMEKHLEYLGFHDQLTGLYNRRYFENELERLGSSRDYPIAVISTDLDGLKLVNDTLGHSEGDSYLQAGAEVLKSALRASDILARVGGDEFALLLPRTDKVAAEMLVNRIRRQLEQYNLKQKSLPLSISLGLAVSESKDYPLEEIYRLADNNMYTDKLQQGKKARAEIVSSLLASLFERGNLAEGERDQVQELAIRLGQALKLPEDHLAGLALFAQVYDLGKVGLPDSIIHSSMQNNASNLSDAEREALHRHPESGYRIASSSPELTDVADLILKHHENYDGSGYPLGLKDDAIPIECRILSVAIAYSAMTNPRAYAETLSHKEALAELKRCAGSQFDPALVEIFANKLQR
jgi:diguanylate cyclase